MLLAHDLAPPRSVTDAVVRGLAAGGHTAIGRWTGRALLNGPHDEAMIRRLDAWFKWHGKDHPSFEAQGGAIARAWARRVVRLLDEDGPPTLAEMFQRAVVPPVGEQARAKAWHSFIEKVHDPHERMLDRAMRLFLTRQASRLAKKIPALVEASKSLAPVTRIADALLLEILDAAAEEARLAATAHRPVLAALKAAIKSSLTAMAVSGVTIPPDAVDKIVTAQIGSMVTDVTATTIQAVKRIIEQGLAAGASVNDMQAGLMRAAAFRPARALTIARTETTRAISAGTVQAIEAVAATGVKVRKQWLSARDDVVRDTHVELDGDTVAPGEDFVSSSGATGQAPGLLGEPGEDINCRCTTLPVVTEEDS